MRAYNTVFYTKTYSKTLREKAAGKRQLVKSSIVIELVFCHYRMTNWENKCYPIVSEQRPKRNLAKKKRKTEGIRERKARNSNVFSRYVKLYFATPLSLVSMKTIADPSSLFISPFRIGIVSLGTWREIPLKSVGQLQFVCILRYLGA